MTSTVIKISWLNLKRDRVALVLSFVLPVVFFSIFAAVFGGLDPDAAAPVDAALLVEDDGDLGATFAATLRARERLRIVADDGGRAAARGLVERGRAAVAIVVPEDFSRSFDPEATGSTRLELLADVANPVAVQRAVAELQAAAIELGYALTQEDEPAAAADAATGPLAIAIADVLGGGRKKPSVAFFAAGIGVMFLLFAVSGRSAILIEEKENGVLTRMLASRLRLGHLLVGRWLFLAALGFAQVSVMFAWGSLAFGLELWTPRHLLGFVVLTAVTAAAAAGFGLVLAAACRTRAQLNGVASVIILIMSAVGGSMFPRFLMPERLQEAGLLTFNAWALDGYQKIFWYEAPLVDLWPQLGVLAALAAAFLAAARRLAARWERC